MAKKDIAIGAFCVWNILALVVWYLPFAPVRAFLMPVFEPYMQATGLCQDFFVFSPDVNTSYAEISGVVQMPDGSTVVWEYPHIVSMNLLEKMVKERYRSYATSILRRSNSYLLPAMARRIAREVYNQNGRSVLPQSVIVRVKWQAVVPPGGGPAPGGVVDIFRLPVEEKDL